MIEFTALIIFFVGVIAKEESELKSFLQISNNGSGVDNDGMEDGKRVLTIFLLNAVGCIVACALVQGVIILSKRMNNELINLRKNYKTYKEFRKFNEFKKNYSIERDTLEATQLDN